MRLIAFGCKCSGGSDLAVTVPPNPPPVRRRIPHIHLADWRVANIVIGRGKWHPGEGIRRRDFVKNAPVHLPGFLRECIDILLN